MAGRKGFTLLEILVVLAILGVIMTIALPNLFVFIGQTNAQAAKNNLLAIAAAQQRYFEDNGSYCINSGANPTCGDNLVDLSTNLRLGLSTNDPFLYRCYTAAGNIPYNCTATYGTSTGAGQLTLNPNAQSPSSPVSCTGSNSFCPS